MSSGTNHKIYHYEVNPPAGVWDRVATALDESALSARFPKTLSQLQVPPPAHCWEQITEALDGQPAFAGKLAGMEVNPPAGVWNKILAGLSMTGNRTRKMAPVWRYAAAALLMGVMAWAGYKLLGNKPGENKVAEKPFTVQQDGSIQTSGAAALFDENIAVSDVNASLEEARNDAALEASKKTFARLDVKEKKSKVRNAHDFLFVTDEYEPANTRGLSFEPDELRPPSVADRYILLMTPEGKMIRMSKKLGELICCVSGEEQDKQCTDQLKKWREKMAHPSTAHSPGNIMDILSLLQSSEN